MIDLATATASQAVAALAEGSLGSAELLDAHLARIERDNAAVNAVVASTSSGPRTRRRAPTRPTRPAAAGARCTACP